MPCNARCYPTIQCSLAQSFAICGGYCAMNCWDLCKDLAVRNPIRFEENPNVPFPPKSWFQDWKLRMPMYPANLHRAGAKHSPTKLVHHLSAKCKSASNFTVEASIMIISQALARPRMHQSVPTTISGHFNNFETFTCNITSSPKFVSRYRRAWCSIMKFQRRIIFYSRGFEADSRFRN